MHKKKLKEKKPNKFQNSSVKPESLSPESLSKDQLQSIFFNSAPAMNEAKDIMFEIDDSQINKGLKKKLKKNKIKT